MHSIVTHATRRRAWLIPALFAVALVALAIAAPAAAHHRPGHGGGPGGGGGEDPPAPLDDGWIYYYGNDGGRVIYRSSPDGATNQALAGAPADYGCPTPDCGGAVGSPSHDTHDGDRWYAVRSFFGGPDDAFPSAGNNGHHSSDIDLVREGQATGITVLDASASCIWVWSNPVFVSDGSGEDTAITWSGVQFADVDQDPAGDCEAFVQAGIFRAELVYSGGAMVGIQSPVLAVETPYEASTYLPDVNGIFSWSPDGAAVAYTRENGSSTGGLYVATPGSAPASHPRIVEGILFDVDWSPDQDVAAGLQTTIAYTGWTVSGKTKGGVWGVQPDGSGKSLLAEAKQGKKWSDPDHIHYTPRWSPAGSHLAYIDYETTGFPGSGIRELRRMAADGSGNAIVQTEPTVPDINRALAWTNPD